MSTSRRERAKLKSPEQSHQESTEIKSRKEQVEELKERSQLARGRLVRLDEVFDPFDEFKETASSYINQEIPIEEENRDWYQFKRAQELRRLLDAESRYVKAIEKKSGLRVDFKWSKWNSTSKDLKPKKNERKRKVSKIFLPVYELLWRTTRTISYKRTRELTEKYDLPLYQDNYQVIVIPNLKKISEELETTIDNVRRQIRRWTDNSGPVRKLKMTTRKRDGGKQIYSLGYWVNDGFKRNPFFTRSSYEVWLREIYFR